MIAMLARVVRERRAVIVPLAALAIINVAAYALAVYPLSRRLEGAEARLAGAQQEEARAEREFERARLTLTSKDRADVELQKFYREVLPADLAGARRITYARLAQLARDANLVAERRSYDPDETYEGALDKLRITMVLQGEYADVRQFIHALETGPEFVVIEDVGLAEGGEAEAPLTLTLQLATYYRPDAHGR